jgi:hypothetical protein
MSNTCSITLRITGEEREAVKAHFDQTASPCGWALPCGFVGCDELYDDGISVEPDAIVIKGVCKWDRHLDIVHSLSQQHPNAAIEMSGTELANIHYFRWTFEAGNGTLLDCIDVGWEDEADVVYMLNGEQFLELPNWVAVTDKSLPYSREEALDRQMRCQAAAKQTETAERQREVAANLFGFTLRVFGTRMQREEVARYVECHTGMTDDIRVVYSKDGWAELWPDDSDVVRSVCQHNDDADELRIHGQSKSQPGVCLAKRLSLKFPSLQMHVKGIDEDGNVELWEVIGGEERLRERRRPPTF